MIRLLQKTYADGTYFYELALLAAISPLVPWNMPNVQRSPLKSPKNRTHEKAKSDTDTPALATTTADANRRSNARNKRGG